jgi:hypothetical protein
VSQSGAPETLQLPTAEISIEVEPPLVLRATYDSETLILLRYVGSLSFAQLANKIATTATRDGMKYLSFIFS